MKKQFVALEISLIEIENDVVTASGINMDVWFGKATGSEGEDGGIFYEN